MTKDSWCQSEYSNRIINWVSGVDFKLLWHSCEQKTNSEQRIKEQTPLIDVLFWSSACQTRLLYIIRGGEGSKATFPVRTRDEIQCDTGAGWQKPQYLQFMSEHTTSAAISGTEWVSELLGVSWLVGLGHTDPCVPASRSKQQHGARIDYRSCFFWGITAKLNCDVKENWKPKYLSSSCTNLTLGKVLFLILASFRLWSSDRWR